MAVRQNGTLWVDGGLRDWSSATVPLMSDAVVRAASVFDGMRAYLADDGSIRLLSGRAHAKRLLRSARVLDIPVDYDVEEIVAAAATVAQAELTETPVEVAYIRPMALAANISADRDHSLTIAGFAWQAPPRTAVRLQVSSLRRPPADTLPPQVKAVANYQLSRLARKAALAAGMDDALFLNHDGRLAESAGAAVVVEQDGVITTPPAWEGALPSITVDMLERIAAATGVEFVRRPVPWPSVRCADGVALAGTLDDLVDVSAVDDVTLQRGSAIAELRGHYRAALAGSELTDLLEFAVCPAVQRAATGR